MAVLTSAFLVDRFAFHGRYFVETGLVANEAAVQVDAKIKEWVQPLHR
jgi:hypothetical protein